MPEMSEQRATACGFARLPRLAGRGLVAIYRYTLAPVSYTHLTLPTIYSV